MTLEEYYKDAQHRMDATVEHTRQELAHIRSGRATPNLLDGIKVSYYGTTTPLKSLANVTAPEARLIVIQVFDKTIIPDIEKAIITSDLGLNPNNDGVLIRVPIPLLTEERRKEFARIVHNLVEDGRIAIRNVRKDINNHLRELERNHDISEDQGHEAHDRIQELTNKHIGDLNTLLEIKEKEIMEE